MFVLKPGPEPTVSFCCFTVFSDITLTCCHYAQQYDSLISRYSVFSIRTAKFSSFFCNKKQDEIEEMSVQMPFRNVCNKQANLKLCSVNAINCNGQ